MNWLSFSVFLISLILSTPSSAQHADEMLLNDVKLGISLVVRNDGAGFDLGIIWPAGSGPNDDDPTMSMEKTSDLARTRLEVFLAEHRWCMNGYTFTEEQTEGAVFWTATCNPSN